LECDGNPEQALRKASWNSSLMAKSSTALAADQNAAKVGNQEQLAADETA